jgi:ribosomal protein S12 methylthiotransferase accessory factor
LIASTFSTIGFGKGDNTYSSLGAQFESLQHFISIYSFNMENEDYLFLSYKDILFKKTPILLHKIPADIRNNANYQDIALLWVKFYSLDNKNDYFYIPCISVEPTYINYSHPEDSFPYHEIYLQHSDNGLAIGCSYEEALTHSLLEVIERDAWALFLKYYFINNVPISLRMVNKKSLKEELKKIIFDVEKKYDTNIFIFQMPNDFDIFTYGAVINLEGYPIAIKGFGASLSEEYAVERAVYEVVQCLAIHFENISNETLETYSLLKNIPHIKKCMQFNMAELIKARTTETIESPHDLEEILNSKNDYLAILLDKISKNNFQIYVRNIYTSDNISLLQTIIPNAEDCFVLSEGIIMPPHDRQIEFLNQKIV